MVEGGLGVGIIKGGGRRSWGWSRGGGHTSHTKLGPPDLRG